MRISSGTEIVAVFVGAANCAASGDPRLKPAIASLWTRLARQSRQDGHRFATIGVALDWTAREGVRYLDQLAFFDETISGRNWLNAGAAKYIWEDMPGEPAMPQIVLVRRRLRADSVGVRVMDEEIVARKVGVPEIVKWAERLERS